MTTHFISSVADVDPIVDRALNGERMRQQDQIELIASENIVSRAVLDALGHAMTNKTLEGYPGNRFHGGGQFVDIVEQLAIDRAKKLFGCGYANVQPHSGSQANLAVFFLLLQPGDSVLSLDLAAGGHLSHGLTANLSGRWFTPHHYSVDPNSEVIDYNAVEAKALKVKPKILIAGGSAYPRKLDFERLGEIAKKVGAWIHVDMAHIAGLVAGGTHPSPFPHADIVTCTTTKTLRGPRGGLILTNNEDWFRRICLGEALQPTFADYAAQIVANARSLASTLQNRNIRIVSGGTDTHLVLLDLSNNGLTGKRAEIALDKVNITSNKNAVPNDSPRPQDWVGLRLGVGAATTRGLVETDFAELGNIIADVIEAEAIGDLDNVIVDAQKRVARMCINYPIYTGD